MRSVTPRQTPARAAQQHNCDGGGGTPKGTGPTWVATSGWARHRPLTLADVFTATDRTVYGKPPAASSRFALAVAQRIAPSPGAGDTLPWATGLRPPGRRLPSFGASQYPRSGGIRSPASGEVQHPDLPRVAWWLSGGAMGTAGPECQSGERFSLAVRLAHPRSGDRRRRRVASAAASPE
jgi:hypothetical protein